MKRYTARGHILHDSATDMVALIGGGAGHVARSLEVEAFRVDGDPSCIVRDREWVPALLLTRRLQAKVARERSRRYPDDEELRQLEASIATLRPFVGAEIVAPKRVAVMVTARGLRQLA